MTPPDAALPSADASIPAVPAQEAAHLAWAPPQGIPQLLNAAQDSTRAVSPDTTSAFGRFGEELDETVRLLLGGEWDALWQKLYVGTIDVLFDLGQNLLLAFLVFLLLYAVFRGVGLVLDRVLDRSPRVDAGLQNLLMKTFRVVMFAFITIVVLGRLGFNITALVAGLSIAGIAVGFAARDSLENFISGVTILLDRPFRVGDNVEVEDRFGTVEEITLRSTRIRTLNNQILVMPNVQMITQKLLNHTMLGTIRVEVPFGIAYKERPQEAREVALKTAEGDERLHASYPPKVVVTELSDSSVNMSLRLYLKNPKQEIPVRFEYIEKVREALREADIEIPFPHRQLFIDDAKAFKDSYLLKPHPPSNGGPASGSDNGGSEPQAQDESG